jgi:hypothetical protein
MSAVVGLLLELLKSVRDFALAVHGMKEGQRKEYLERYVDPAYEAAEEIYRDFRSLLDEVRREASEGESPDRIISLLKERRGQLYPVRSQLRADIATQLEKGRVTRFEAGLIGMMSGAMTSLERPYFQTYSYVDGEGSVRPVVGQHTVLDILDQLERSGSDDFGAVRGDIVRAVDNKLRGLEKAWLDVVRGYAELKEGTIPDPRKLPRASPPARRLAEIGSALNDLYGMAATGQYSRRKATDFEELIAKEVPPLHPPAQELREIVHDLEGREPNVTSEMLRDSLDEFVRRYDHHLASETAIGD